VSREYLQWEHDIVIAGVTYRVEYDQTEPAAEGDCVHHSGTPAILTKHIDLYEIRGDDDVPIEGETLRLKALKVLKDGEPLCEQCIEQELEP